MDFECSNIQLFYFFSLVLDILDKERSKIWNPGVKVRLKIILEDLILS